MAEPSETRILLLLDQKFGHGVVDQLFRLSCVLENLVPSLREQSTGLEAARSIQLPLS